MSEISDPFTKLMVYPGNWHDVQLVPVLYRILEQRAYVVFVSMLRAMRMARFRPRSTPNLLLLFAGKFCISQFAALIAIFTG